jgi:L-serine dehydratase
MEELMALAESKNCAIYDLIIEYESENSEESKEEIYAAMKKNWQVMQQSARQGISNKDKSISGLVGGDAKMLDEYRHAENSFLGALALKAAAYALAVSEVNAIMGKIVACPTAGSCGIVPAAVLAAAEEKKYSEQEVINALFTAAGVGMIIAENASIAGAEGGCQAECGSAAAMAAAALTQLGGGTVRQVGEAAALALKNLLGLVCDPVAGLVEVPCVKRNGFASVHAIVASDMALAGIKSAVPPDEVIETMYKVGLAIPKSLRETSAAGLADAPSARAVEQRIYKKK